MTLKTSDRVFETTTTTGTGIKTLLGPVSGFQSFVTGVGNGAKVPYTITQADAFGVIVSWECGIGTVTDAASDTLTPNTVLRSSNANAAVNFGAGTKNVYLGFIADVVPTRDENLNFIEGFWAVTGTANALSFTLPVAPKAYSDGMIIRGFATLANAAGATTVNVNSLGNKNVKVNGADPAASVLIVGGYFEAVYKAASGWFEIVSQVLGFASQAEAVAGTENTKVMTALRTKQAKLGCFDYNNMAYFKNILTSGTNQAGYAAGTNKVPFNTQVFNNIPGLTFDDTNDRFTFANAGTYWLEAEVPNVTSGSNPKLRWYDVTAAAYVNGIEGDALFGGVGTGGANIGNKHTIDGPFVAVAGHVYELRFYTTGASGSTASSQGPEHYEKMKITQVA